jgi:hypothetical protein
MALCNRPLAPGKVQPDFFLTCQQVGQITKKFFFLPILQFG